MTEFDVLAERYDRLYRDNPVQVRACQELLRCLEPRARVMDLGCGAGRPVGVMLTRAGHVLHGYDVSAEMLALARRNCPGASFTHTDLRVIDGPPDHGRVDAVVAHLSLLMLSRAEIRETLGTIATWLRAGGLLSLGMVDVDADQSPVRFLDHPLRISGWAGAELSRVVAETGYDIVSYWIGVFRPEGRNPERQSFVLARVPA